MGDVDTSFYPKAPANGFGSLTPAGVVGLAQGINNAKLQQMDIAGRQGVSDAVAGGFDENGQQTPDLVSNLAKNGGIHALPAIQQAVENARSQVALGDAKRSSISNWISPLAGMEKPTDKDVLKAIPMLTHLPGITPQDTKATMDFVLQDKNPQGIRNRLAILSNQTRGAAMVTPTQGGYDPATGQARVVPQGTANIRAAQPGGAAFEAPPGVKTAAETAGTQAGDAISAARIANLNFRSQVYPLEQAIPALERLGKTGTGPGTEEFNNLKSFLQSAGIPGLDVNKIKDFDEAQKYLTDWVNQNGNSGTNDKLAAAFAGNPNVHISNAAAVDVAKSALALRRMKLAQQATFEKTGLPDSEFPKWASKNFNMDPRVYGFDLMKTAQRKSLLESLPAAKRDLFMLNVQDAAQDGIIKAPQANNAR